ncbi:hypothetical protein RUND412_006525 [Rhizina undulata]
MSAGRESSSSPSIIVVDNVDRERPGLPNDWVEPVPMDAALYLEVRLFSIFMHCAKLREDPDGVSPFPRPESEPARLESIAEYFDEPASPDNHHHPKSSVNISHKKSASIERNLSSSAAVRPADQPLEEGITGRISPPSVPISDIGDIPSSESVSKCSTKFRSTAKRATAASVFLNAWTPVGVSTAKSHSFAVAMETSSDLYLEKTADSMGPASIASGSVAAPLGDFMQKMEPISVEHGVSILDVETHKIGSWVPSGDKPAPGNDKERDVSGGNAAVSSNLPDGAEAEMVKGLDLKMEGPGRSQSIIVDESDELEGQGNSKQRTKDHNVIATDGSNISEWHGGEWPGGEWPNDESPLHRDHQIYLYYQGLDDMPSVMRRYPHMSKYLISRFIFNAWRKKYDDSFEDEIQQVNMEKDYPFTSPGPQVAKDSVTVELSNTEGNCGYPDCDIPVAVRGQSDVNFKDKEASDGSNAGFVDTDETIMVLKERAPSGISVDSLVQKLGSRDNRASTRKPNGSMDLQAVVKHGKNSEEIEGEAARYKAAVENVNSLRSQIVSSCSDFSYVDTEAARYKAAVDNVNSLRSQIVSPSSDFAYSDTEAEPSMSPLGRIPSPRVFNSSPAVKGPNTQRLANAMALDFEKCMRKMERKLSGKGKDSESESSSDGSSGYTFSIAPHEVASFQESIRKHEEKKAIAQTRNTNVSDANTLRQQDLFVHSSAPGPPPGSKELTRKYDESRFGQQMRNPYVPESSILRQQDHFMRSPTPSPSPRNTRDHNRSFSHSSRTIMNVVDIFSEGVGERSSSGQLSEEQLETLYAKFRHEREPPDEGSDDGVKPGEWVRAISSKKAKAHVRKRAAPQNIESQNIWGRKSINICSPFDFSSQTTSIAGSMAGNVRSQRSNLVPLSRPAPSSSRNFELEPSGIEWTRPQASRDAPRSRQERELLAEQQAEQHYTHLLVEQWRARGFHEVAKLDDKAHIKLVENHWKEAPELPVHSVGIEWSNSTPRGSPNHGDARAKKIPIETWMPTVDPTPAVSRTPTVIPAEPVFPRFGTILGTIPSPPPVRRPYNTEWELNYIANTLRNLIMQSQQKSTKKRTDSTITQQTIVKATKEPGSAKNEQASAKKGLVSAQKGSVSAQKGPASAQKVTAKPKATNQLRPYTPPKAPGNKMHGQQLPRALPSVTDAKIRPVCSPFLNGKCKRGQACPELHPIWDLKENCFKDRRYLTIEEYRAEMTARQRRADEIIAVAEACDGESEMILIPGRKGKKPVNYDMQVVSKVVVIRNGKGEMDWLVPKEEINRHEDILP